MQLEGSILAMVVTRESTIKIGGGGAPVFIAQDEGERQALAQTLSRVLDAVAHDLENGVMLLVRH